MASRYFLMGNMLAGTIYPPNTTQLNSPSGFTAKQVGGASDGVIMGQGIENPTTLNLSSTAMLNVEITPINGYVLDKAIFRKVGGQFPYAEFLPDETGKITVNVTYTNTPSGNYNVIEVNSYAQGAEPVLNKNFIVGNNATGSGTISQIGTPTFKSYVVAVKESGTYETELVLGTETLVDVGGASRVYFKNVANSGNIFTSCRTGGGSVTTELPIQDNEFIVELTKAQWEANQRDRRQLVIMTTESATKNFVFGNSKDSSGKPILTGDNSFTGVLTLYGGYNFETGGYDQITREIKAGDDLNISLTAEYNSGSLVLNVVDGFKFVGVEFPSEGTFTNNQIDYNISSELLDLSVNEPLYFIAYTESTAPQPSDKPDTILNNYLLTKDELYDFQKQIYNIVAFEETENVQTPITDYISNLYVYPFKIPESALYGRQVIKCRNREFNIAEQFQKDTISLNLGNISINKVHNNSLDYMGVSCSLYLPFISGSINLDSQMVTGKELNINYVVNINDGSTTVNITDILTDVIINVSKTQLGAIQPFFDFLRVTQKDYTPSQSINDIDTAYIIMEMPDYSQTNPTVIIEGSLQGIKGRVSVNDVTLETTAFNDEKLNIISLLSQGVFIK